MDFGCLYIGGLVPKGPVPKITKTALQPITSLAFHDTHPGKVRHTEPGPDVPQQRLRRGTVRDQQRHRGREALLAHPNRPRVRRIPGTGHLPGKRTFTGPVESRECAAHGDCPSVP